MVQGNRRRGLLAWTALVAALGLAPAAAQAVGVQGFSGHITDVGILRGPGQTGGVEYRIRGRFKVDHPLDLGASVVTLERLFDEIGAGGAGELMTTVDDAPFLPYVLAPTKIGSPDKLRIDTPDFRPQIRFQAWKVGDTVEFRLKLDRGLMRRRPLLCSDAPVPTTDMAHTFKIDDGVHPAVRVSTVQPWECNEKDNNLRSRGRRSSPSPLPTPPGPVPSPRPTVAPTPTPRPSATPVPGPSAAPPPGCNLPDGPTASLLIEARTRNTGQADLVELDGGASRAAAGAIVRYRFQSGDGRVQDGPAAKAAFEYAPGDYRARLTVWDAQGRCGTATRGYSEK